MTTRWTSVTQPVEDPQGNRWVTAAQDSEESQENSINSVPLSDRVWDGERFIDPEEAKRRSVLSSVASPAGPGGVPMDIPTEENLEAGQQPAEKDEAREILRDSNPIRALEKATGRGLTDSVPILSTVLGDEEEMAADTLGLYTAQSFGKGVADMADIADFIVNASPIGHLKHYLGQYVGAIPEDEPYNIRYGQISDLYERSMISAYEKGGMPAELIKPKTATERGIGLIGENFGAGSVIKLGQAMYRGAKGLGTMILDDFTRAEVVASTTGGTVGGLASSLYEDEKRSEQVAALGNFVASMWGGIKYAPSMMTARKAASIIMGRDVEDVWKLSDEVIMQDLSKLVPEDMVPVLKERIEVVRAIQELDSRFTPTVGSLIGTAEAVQVQRIVDTNNIEKASFIYRQNEEVVRSLVETYGLNPRGKEYNLIREAIKETSSQGKDVAERIQQKIVELRIEIDSLGRTDATTAPDKVGQDLRDQLKTFRTALKEHRNHMYDIIDPEGSVRFDSAALGNILSTEIESARRALSTKVWRQADEGYEYVQELKKMISFYNEGGYVNFNQLDNLRKDILSAKDELYHKTNGSSQAIPLLGRLSGAIDNIFDTRFMDDYTEVGDRYRAAREVHKTMWTPQFVHETSTGTRILSQTPSGAYKIDADKIMAEIWKEPGARQGPSETSALKLREIISTRTDITDPEILDAAEQAVILRVQDYALSLANKAIMNSPDPDVAFRNWVRANEVNLSNFPELKPHIDEMGQMVTMLTLKQGNYTSEIEAINRNIIQRFSNSDPETFINNISSMSQQEADETLKRLLAGMGAEDPYLGMPPLAPLSNIDSMKSIDSFIETLQGTDPALYENALQLRQAVSSEVLNRVVLKNLTSDGTKGLNFSSLEKIMNGSSDQFPIHTLETVLTPADLNNLKMLHRMSGIVDNLHKLTPQSKVEMDEVKKLAKTFNVSIPSVSSRIYAAKLGKVGPVFIITDTGVKLLRGYHAQNIQKRHSEIMYNLEGLEKVINKRLALSDGTDKEIYSEFVDGIKDYKKVFAALKDQLAKKNIDPIQAFVDAVASGTNILNIERLREYMEVTSFEAQDEYDHLDHAIDVFDIPTLEEPVDIDVQGGIERMRANFERSRQEMSTQTEQVEDQTGPKVADIISQVEEEMAAEAQSAVIEPEEQDEQPSTME